MGRQGDHGVSFIAGFIAGVFALLGYVVWRMLRSDGWDQSNITNALRLLSHVAMHPEDFGKMWYVVRRGDDTLVPVKRPFWYIEEDEIETVVNSRPE